MSFELGEAIRRCGLETGARRAVLDALACYTDAETGLARVSRISVAVHAGIAEKTAMRVLKDLCEDDALGGLVRRIREASGRGNPAVYRVDLARLEPLGDAIKMAGRRVYAGVGKAMADRGLIGRKASPENIRAVFACLGRLLREEDEPTTLRAVESLRDAFEAAMLRVEEMSVIGIPIVPEKERNAPVDKSPDAACADDEKGDISSRKGDISSRPYNKDSSPSGIITFAREAPPVEKILAAQAASEDEMLFCVEGLLAYATLSRKQRLDLISDLQGRIIRVDRKGILAIRADGEADALRMSELWLDQLVRWAAEVGLSGVVFDAAFAPETGEI